MASEPILAPKQVTGLADGRWTGACVRKRRARLAADTPFAELLAIGIGAAISERTRVSGGWPVFPTAETSVTVIHSHTLPSASPCLSKEGDWKQHCIVK